ncbi:hypothetical protein BH11PSE8_BH11PSE8_33800 [soil metagenome]
MKAPMWRGRPDRPRAAAGSLRAATARVRRLNSERDDNRRRLGECRSLLSQASRLARIGYWSIELPAQRVRWSDDIPILLELAPDHVPTLADVLDRCPPPWREPLDAAVQACAQYGTPFDMLLQLTTATARLIWVRLLAEAVRNSAGRITCVQGVLQDIAEAQRKDAALRQSYDAVLLSERRFRSVFNQQFQFMTILSPEGLVLEISEQLPLRPGAVPREEVLGKLFWDTAWWENIPEMRSQWPARLEAAARQEGPLLSEDHFTSSTGMPRIALAAVTAVKDAAGRVDCFIVQATDVTEIKQAEATRQRLEEQLRETHKMQAIGTLAGGIAHDFNNILGAILGNVALAQDEVDVAHPAQARLEQIHKAGNRARSLVRRILAFSRRQANDLSVQPLQPIVEETMALLRTTLPARVSLELEMSRQSMWVRADGTQIQQVLMNLCTNGWHALQGAAGRVEVGLMRADLPASPEQQAAAWPAGPCAHLWVRDSGSGMDEGTRARIFEPFFTTKSVAEGTGLGLSVAHGIVAEHGGAITVESEPGRGSTFHVYLPLAQTPDDTRPAPLLIPERARGKGEHILYVDDDDTMVVMVQILLERAGYRVTVCHDAPTALAAVRATPLAFDLIVSDFNMPDVSGLDMAVALAEIRPGLPVVISSGYLSDELRAGAAEAGVRRLLRKENTLEELCDVVRDLLG